MITIRYSDASGSRLLDVDQLLRIAPFAMEEGTLVWVDMSSPTADEEQRILADWFGVHDLVLSDMRRAATEMDELHHPKVEEFGNYLYVIMHALDLTSSSRGDALQYAWRQANFLIGEHVLITHHAGNIRPIESILSLCDVNPRMLHRGPDYVLHLLLDEIVDQYMPLLTRFEDVLQSIEQNVFKQATTLTLARIIDVKRRLQETRRTIVYQRELVNRLARGEFDLVSLEESVYYRNVYDHLVRTADQLDTAREAAMGMMEVYFSVNNTRLNQIMKLLTVISTIFLPLTFISSVYGMNFKHMPELDWPFGYAMVWGILVTITIVMVMFFKRRGWLD
jgi:magnesium transporter